MVLDNNLSNVHKKLNFDQCLVFRSNPRYSHEGFLMYRVKKYSLCISYLWAKFELKSFLAPGEIPSLEDYDLLIQSASNLQLNQIEVHWWSTIWNYLVIIYFIKTLFFYFFIAKILLKYFIKFNQKFLFEDNLSK
jgi:hypothetical protein